MDKAAIKIMCILHNESHRCQEQRINEAMKPPQRLSVVSVQVQTPSGDAESVTKWSVAHSCHGHVSSQFSFVKYAPIAA